MVEKISSDEYSACSVVTSGILVSQPPLSTPGYRVIERSEYNTPLPTLHPNNLVQ